MTQTMFDIFNIRKRRMAKKEAAEKTRLEYLAEKKRVYQERKSLIDSFLKEYRSKLDQKEREEYRETKQWADKINSKCPKCGSTNVINQIRRTEGEIHGSGKSYTTSSSSHFLFGSASSFSSGSSSKIPNNAVLSWLEKQGEKKPSVNCLLNWSEVDEKMLQSLEGIVKDYWAKAEQEKNEIKIREASNVSYFLKTIQKSPLCWIKCSDELPNRDGTYLVVTDGSQNDVYDMAKYDSIDGWHKASEILYWMPIPQLNNKSIVEQKSAWSEEDERLFQIIIDILDRENHLGNITHTDLIACVRKLKSLIPQTQWKPSDEQMKFLWKYAEQNNYDGAVLTSLFHDLKKLREE